MGALLKVTQQHAENMCTRRTVAASYDLLNLRLADAGMGKMNPPHGETDDRIAADIAELVTGYEGLLDLRSFDEDEDMDTSPAAQQRAAAAAEEASWRRRTGPEVWFDRRTDRERRAQRMEDRVMWFIGGAGVLAVLEVLAWAVTR